MQVGIAVTLHEALKQGNERQYLFSASTAALQSALKGEFTDITAEGAALAGIEEVDTISTLTLTATHTHHYHRGRQFSTNPKFYL
jgi:hypothetical protein